jgi:4,5-DOPA dioxygenase extradiol
MKRSDFLKALAILPITGAAMKLNDLHALTQPLSSTDKMPVLFIGHGSPMNGIENNEFSAYWKKLGQEIPQPRAVLCVSAHWLTKGTAVTAMDHPKTIHDFGGFPQALFDVEYPAPGSPEIANETKAALTSIDVGLDHDWGLDHGTWTIIRHMYPGANIPVLQLSIDYYKPASYHYNLAKELAALRRKGMLIVGSGNMVHNLGMVDFSKLDSPGFGFDWALEINETFKKNILSGNHQALIDYEKLGPSAKLAIPTPDHYYPLMYAIGMLDSKDEVGIFNDKAVAGSLTMTSVRTA